MRRLGRITDLIRFLYSIVHSGFAKTEMALTEVTGDVEETQQLLHDPCDLCEKLQLNLLAECTVNQRNWYEMGERGSTTRVVIQVR
jgi:hypothetical protein